MGQNHNVKTGNGSTLQSCYRAS